MIPNEIYENLTPPERIRAAISAMARNDQEELHTLSNTAPKKFLRMHDPSYTDGMQRLLSIAAVVESDLRGVALNFLVAAHMKDDALHGKAFIEAASIYTAWHTLLAEHGIPDADMQAAGYTNHPVVTGLLMAAAGQEDADQVQDRLTIMREIMAA